MATWVAPIDSHTDPDAPLTSELGKRWDNNVIAAFEVASGAPRLGRRVSVDGSSATSCIHVVPSGYLGCVGYLRGSMSTSGVSLELSDDGGATYSTAGNISAGGIAGSIDLFFQFYFATGGATFFEMGRAGGGGNFSGATKTGVPSGSGDKIRKSLPGGNMSLL